MTLSCAIAPRQSAQLPSAAATPMLAAAGIVVTEISTPTRAPDLAEVSESIPAAPAKQATMNEKASGLEMNWVSGLSTLLKSASTRPVATQISVNRKAAVIPTGKPTARAVSERRATLAAPLDDRHAEAGERPELGPDDHRADDQDRRAGEDPDRGDQAGEDHEGEEVAAELGRLRGARLDLLPDDRVGGQPAGGALGRLRRVRDLRVDLLERDRAPRGARRAP